MVSLLKKKIFNFVISTFFFIFLLNLAIMNSDQNINQPLSHMQKDLRLALSMADTIEQPLPLIAASNEVFKHAKRMGYGNHDSSAVWYGTRY